MQIMNQKFLLLFLNTIAAALSLCPEAIAGSIAASGHISLTSSVMANCISSVSGNISLTYDSVVANSSNGSDLIDQHSASVRYTCTKDLPVSIELSYGNNANGTQRNLKNGTNFLSYNLKTPSGADWGNNALTVTGTGTIQNTIITVVIPKGQNPSFANGNIYSDTITANLRY